MHSLLLDLQCYKSFILYICMKNYYICKYYRCCLNIKQHYDMIISYNKEQTINEQIKNVQKVDVGGVSPRCS